MVPEALPLAVDSPHLSLLGLYALHDSNFNFNFNLIKNLASDCKFQDAL